jgi:hypothetical protein
MQVLINAPVYLLMIFMLLAIFLVVYQVFWANNIDKKKALLYILISALLLTELAWSVSFLSLNYFVLALILAVSYYTLIGLLRFHLLNKLNKTLVKVYLSFGILAIVLVLLTSRWL